MAIFNMFVGTGGVYGMQLAVPGIGALYLVLAGIQNSILKLTCYGTIVNPEIRDMIQAYYYECNAEEKARIEEEERILKLAQEIKLRRKQENVEFVEEMNKKNPIFIEMPDLKKAGKDGYVKRVYQNDNSSDENIEVRLPNAPNYQLIEN